MGRLGRAGFRRLSADKTPVEPVGDLVERQAPRSDGYDKVVNASIIGNVEPIPAAPDQKFHEEPGRPLVAIDEAVVAHYGMDQRGTLPSHRAVVSGVGPRDAGLD